MNAPDDLFFPATRRFAVNEAIPHDYLVMLDLEHTPPLLILEGPTTDATGEVETRTTTPEEMTAIEAWLASLPVA